MNLWAEFWRFWLILSGAAFAGITVVVAWRGMGDLLAMFRDLGAEKGAVDHGRDRLSR